MFVKVCGIRTRGQIDWAVELGYHAVGFVLHPGSPRCCDATRARRLARYARGRIATVAVGIAYEEVAPLEDVCDYIQIYEFRGDTRLIFAGAEPPPEGCSLFLYDAGRGDGVCRAFPDWLQRMEIPTIISGGLTDGNVADVIRRFRPFGVDVSSGVERIRGVKDYHLMRRFMEEVRRAAE